MTTKKQAYQFLPPPPPPHGSTQRFGSMRAATTAALLLAVASVTMTMTACEPATPTTSGSGAGGSGAAEPPPSPTPTPDPTAPDPAPPEPMKWTLDAAQFGDDGGSIWIESSNRSQPFAWGAITAGNADAVRVSIGGVALAGESRSFTSTAFEPAFEGDYSGAEWTISAEVTPGAVALVLTAPNQRFDQGDLSHVEVTNGGLEYDNIPAVTFADPPAGGRRATGVAAGPGQITSVATHGGNVGSGYTSPPSVRIFRTCCGTHDGGVELEVTLNGGSIGPIRVLNPGSGFLGTGWSCQFIPRLGGANCVVYKSEQVRSIELTYRGRGYKVAPAVTITLTGPNGRNAAARAVLRGPTGNTQVENLFWGRQALYGKELLIEIAAEE